MEIYKQIRKMRLDGMSQRQIATVLHISRNTVKKYWNGDSIPWERKDYNREATVLTEDVVTFVRQCLDEDAHNPRKQQHTAKRIYDRLVAEFGFTGGETTVRRLVRELREKSREAFVPLAFPAGDAMQIDWGEATVYLGGVKTNRGGYFLITTIINYYFEKRIRSRKNGFLYARLYVACFGFRIQPTPFFP